jgi:hypothetical protein
MASKTALSEFIDETLSILDALKVASRAMLASPRRNDAAERVELGLHTIKGNAAAFEFEDLSATAGALLDLVRDAGAGAAAEVGRILEFSARAEQYLDRVRDGDAPPPGFFTSIFEGKRAVTGQKSTVRKRAETAPPPAPSSRDRWENEVDEILRGAPAVSPRIEAISRVAAGTPVEPGDGGKPEPAPPPPGGVAEPEDRLRSGAAGYAFEAALAFETVKTLATQYKADPRLSGLISGLAEFFKSFGKWGTEARSVPISSYLAEALEWAARFAESLGKKLHSEIHAEGALVLPGVGSLIRELVKEVLRSLVPAPARGAPTAIQARVAVQRAPGYFTLRISGLSQLQRTSSRLQLYSIQERVEKTGIMIGHGEMGGEILIDVPDNLGSIEVLVLQARNARVGVPWHRVTALEESWTLETGLRGDGWAEIRGEKVSVVDLTAGGSQPGKGQEKGAAIVVLRTESGKQGVLVDRILERQEMPIQVAAHADWQSDVIGLCIAPADFKCMPLLRWSLR